MATSPPVASSVVASGGAAASPPPSPGAAAAPPSFLEGAVSSLLSGPGAEPSQAQPTGAPQQTPQQQADALAELIRTLNLPPEHPAMKQLHALRTQAGRFAALERQQAQQQPTDEGWQAAWNANVRLAVLGNQNPVLLARDLGLDAELTQDFLADVQAAREAAGEPASGVVPQGPQGAAAASGGATVAGTPQAGLYEAVFAAPETFQAAFKPLHEASIAIRGLDAKAARLQAALMVKDLDPEERKTAEQDLRDVTQAMQMAEAHHFGRFMSATAQLVEHAIKQQEAKIAPLLEVFAEAERQAQAEEARHGAVQHFVNSLQSYMVPDGEGAGTPLFGTQPGGLGIYESDEQGRLRLDADGFVIPTELGRKHLPAAFAYLRSMRAVGTPETLLHALRATISTSEGTVQSGAGSGQVGGDPLAQLAASAAIGVGTGAGARQDQQALGPRY